MRFAGLGAILILIVGCANPAEYGTLHPPKESPDLNVYILERYQADVDRAFEAVEAKGRGTFSRIRLDLRVTAEGGVLHAKVAIAENWNGLLLAALKPSMGAWKLPKSGQPYTRTVELIRSVESLRSRKKDFKIER